MFCHTSLNTSNCCYWHPFTIYRYAVFPLEFWLVRICPNDKFIEIFAQKFHYFQDPFYKFLALNLLFQETSYSLPLKYSSFFSFSVLHFIILISGSKSVKFTLKFCIFLKFLTLEGTLPLRLTIQNLSGL